MKQKLLLRFLSTFVFLFASSLLFCASAQAAGLFVIGDSIGVGVVRFGGLNPDGYHARGNAQVREIAGYSITGPAVQASNPSPVTRFSASASYDRVVISAGSNCPSCSNNARDLEVIRNKFPNARAVWVVPYNSTAAGTVRQVAAAHPGDQLVELSRFASNDNVHPNDYAAVGREIQSKLGSGGGAAPSPNQPNVASPSITETPARVDNSAFGLIPCGRKAGQGAVSEPCTACHAVIAGKNLIDYLTRIMVVVAVAVIVAMGVLYIVSGVNANLKKTAKAGLTAVLIGLIFMLSAWLIVSTLLRFLANPSVVQGGSGFIGLQSGQGVFGLQCSTASDAGRGTLVSGGRVVTTPYTGGAGGNGTCSPITTAGNPCSVERLRNTCFSANAETWSRMCNLESRGTPIQSQTDRCGNFGNRSFSGGLFQVNIIANGGMLDRERCNNIATVNLVDSNCMQWNSGHTVCISWRCVAGSDFDNWDYCMGLTMNEQTNIQAACQLSEQGHKTTPWPHTRRVCGVPERI